MQTEARRRTCIYIVCLGLTHVANRSEVRISLGLCRLCRSATPSLDDGWFEINKVTSRKKIRGKDTFLVHWSDGSTSREPAENITEYAKAQYFIALERRKKHRKRNK